MKNIVIISVFAVVSIAGLVSGSMAGHNYHGHSMNMSEMSEMDINNDGMITFDEFSAPHTETLRSAFKMLDTNKDEVISEEEWNEFLKVHGIDKQYEG